MLFDLTDRFRFTRSVTFFFSTISHSMAKLASYMADFLLIRLTKLFNLIANSLRAREAAFISSWNNAKASQGKQRHEEYENP